MHSSSVVVCYLRVNLPEREWWIDLPELASIRLGEDAFCFKWDYRLSELIMRSSDGEVSWWIDSPKLTTLTTVEGSSTFNCPRSITLEGISYHSILTNRHALSDYCYSSQEYGFQPWNEDRSHEESLSCLSLIPRHHACSSILSLISCFFHTQSHRTIQSSYTPSRVMWSNLPPFTTQSKISWKDSENIFISISKSPKIAIPAIIPNQVWESILSTPT